MLERVATDPAGLAEGWVADFAEACAAGRPEAIAALLREDAHWRDLASLRRRFATVSGRAAAAGALARALREAGLRDLRIDPDRRAPMRLERAGEEVVEAILAYDTDRGPGEGVVRLTRGADGALRAWSLLTALADLPQAPEKREEAAVARDFHGPNWLDRRRAEIAYQDRDPAVLIVGGGHAGLTAAARLRALGVDALVVDRMARIGDNWRLRYHALMLHNTKHSNHLPYLPFPETWPDFIPKDKIANWLELYVEAMEINFWTRTSFEGAVRDEAAGCWEAALTLPDGAARVMRPRHIVMATSVSGTPHIPEIPTLDRFGGEVCHSSAFGSGAERAGRPAMVIGTGTSGHDIAQDLHAWGAKVTMVQRNPTLVVNVQPSAQLYDGIYLGQGPSLEERDLLNLATPLEQMKQAHRLLTAKARDCDRELLEGLERAGFRLDFGEDGTGWPLKYRTRAGATTSMSAPRT
ncbi:MAG: FAD-dependent oxidoreductase [Pseudomonadota bacterium]